MEFWGFENDVFLGIGEEHGFFGAPGRPVPKTDKRVAEAFVEIPTQLTQEEVEAFEEGDFSDHPISVPVWIRYSNDPSLKGKTPYVTVKDRPDKKRFWQFRLSYPEAGHIVDEKGKTHGRLGPFNRDEAKALLQQIALLEADNPVDKKDQTPIIYYRTLGTDGKPTTAYLSKSDLYNLSRNGPTSKRELGRASSSQTPGAPSASASDAPSSIGRFDPFNVDSMAGDFENKIEEVSALIALLSSLFLFLFGLEQAMITALRQMGKRAAMDGVVSSKPLWAGIERMRQANKDMEDEIAGLSGEEKPDSAKISDLRGAIAANNAAIDPLMDIIKMYGAQAKKYEDWADDLGRMMQSRAA